MKENLRTLGISSENPVRKLKTMLSSDNNRLPFVLWVILF